MKKSLILLIVSVMVLGACRKIVVDNNGTTTAPVVPPTGGQTITIKGKISTDTVFRAANTYILEGLVYIKNNATLTIEAGTTIKASYLDPIGGLVITRGAKVVAQGSADKPIVFTSNSPNPRSGDWAGIVLLGKAPANAAFNGAQGTGSIEGGINNADGDGIYGGTDENDNSGVLSYVRIEYAGFAFLPDNEINSLTMGGVGRGTKIDHVQVTYAKDDAFEWFGGTVDCKFLVAYKTTDDDFDTDNGYSGRVQYGLIVRDSTIADISRSEAFESDNDANGSTLTPKTSAVFSNITALGPLATLSNNGNNLYLAAAQIRRNSTINIFNSALIGWPTGLIIDASKGRATDLNIDDSTLRVRHTVIAGCKTPVAYSASASSPTGATTASITTWFTSSPGNSILATVNDAQLANPFSTANFDPTPFAASPLAKGGTFTDPKLSTWFDKVAFRGAVPPSGAEANWWKGWTRFN
jgi:hypothetical protein